MLAAVLPRQTIHRVVLLMCVLGSLTSSTAQAMQDESPVTEEQLNYSKKLFAEGDAAMKKKNYELALSKFQEAYRYAPHLHLFTFNIASAAEALGKCVQAQLFYRAFLERVPEHPLRKQVKKKVDKLTKECPYDPESSTMLSPEEQAKRKAERETEAAERAMTDALTDLREAKAFYETAAEKHPGERTFKRGARRKKCQIKKMLKLMAIHNVEDPGSSDEAVAVDSESYKACRKAESKESRILGRLETIPQLWNTVEAEKHTARLSRQVSADEAKADACGVR